jgi:LuxR family transcriptional regulator, maltose regulon positive regulatory protein
MKSNLSSIAKISRPKLPNVMRRNRLFKELDKDRKKPLTWIFGPAGSGKTALISSYLDAKKIPCLWYQIDSCDTDVATFFYYLGLAAKKALPRQKKPFPLLTPEFMPSLLTFGIQFFEAMFTRLKPPYAIVFDNYHEIPEASPVHNILQKSLSRMPDGIRVFVLSRSGMPQEFTRERVSDSLGMLGWNDLQFTLDESKELVRSKRKMVPSRDILLRLNDKTEGWAAGLLLMIENAGSVDDFSGLLGQGGHHKIFSYFAGEILDKLDGDLRDILLNTSFLPRFTAQMAQRMTDHGQAGQLLAGLSKNNFFTERLSGSEPAYRYHHLFREFLQQRIIASTRPEAVARIRKKAAQLLLEDGQVEETATLFIQEGDWGGLIQIIVQNARELVAAGRHHTLAEWIAHVPAALRGESPWLLYWLAVCRMPFNLAECRENLESAFQLFTKKNDLTGLLLSCSGILDTYAIGFSDFTHVDQWIDKFEEILKRSGGFPVQELEIHATFVMFLILSMRKPDHPRFSYWYKKARSLIRHCRDNSQRVINATFLLHYYSWIGFPPDASSLMKELRLRIEAPDVPPVIKIMGLMVEAIHGWCTASFAEGQKAAAKALELARCNSIHHLEGKLYAQEIYRTTIIGDCEASTELVQKLAASTNFDNPLDAAHFHMLASFEARCRNDSAVSLEHALTSETLARAGGAPFPLALSEYNLGQALFENNRIQEARLYTERALQTARMMKSVILEFSCLLLEALFAFESDEEASDQKGLAKLRSALSLGRAHSVMAIGGWKRNTLARLCARALDEGIEPEFLRRFIRAHNLTPDDPVQTGENWPWPVTIHTLGCFELVLNSMPFRVAGKSQKRPLQMLKILIAAGPRGIHKETMVDELWPDAEGDDGGTVFRTTLSRLRRLIGNDRAILLQEGTLSLDPRFCWVDAWTFERYCGRITEIKERMDAKNSVQITSLSEQAAKLYDGSFLASDLDIPMAVPVRERLRSKYIRLITDLGRIMEENGNGERALVYYSAGLEADPLAEELYQGLIACNLRLGRKAEAMTSYMRCKKVLQTVLCIEPSQKTELLKLQITER